MINYNELTESVFNWLMDKNKTDPSFTFSLRQKANKGSELNYFIGTERSKYFGTTLWNIPVGFPGSSQDLIDIFFGFDDNNLKYYIEFTQTKNPDTKQNTSALNLIQHIKEEIRSSVGIAVESRQTSKMESYKTKSPKKTYSTIEDLLSDLEKQLYIVIPIVEKGILDEQKMNTSFIAHRINGGEFNDMLLKLKERQKKYAKKTETGNDLSNEPNNTQKDLETSGDKFPLNQILFGPPGTGKTYNTVNKALEIIDERIDGKSRKEIKELFDNKMKEGQIVFTTFHQSMSYEDFVEGIKPQEPKVEGHHISYKVEDGIFKKLCQKANSSFGNIENVLEDFKNEISEVDGKKPITIKAKGTSFDVVYRGTNVFYIQPHASIKNKPWYPVNIDNILKVFKTGDFTGVYNPTYVREIVNFLEKNRGLKKGQNENNIDKPFVLIIDEINRGNISQIFGELITLIEEDKRLGNDEALEALLPYSKGKFGVPANLYIIGTMNTADRSVEAIDTALRRRFCFEEMAPLYDLDDLNYEIAGHNVSKILFTINKRIEKLLDKDHAIGHSYFIRRIDETPEEKFLNSFYHNIIPLLQEYFFGDFGKIGLVLGQGFVRMKEWNKNSDSFADFDYESASEFEDRPVYEIIDYRIEQDGIGKFLVAVKRLMNDKIE